eukprot:6478297-Amphidinium_carterae.1
MASSSHCVSSIHSDMSCAKRTWTLKYGSCNSRGVVDKASTSPSLERTARAGVQRDWRLNP